VAFTSENRARDVIHNFNADGFSSLYPKYKGARPPKFTLAQRREINKIAKSMPAAHGQPFSTWNLPKLGGFPVTEGLVADISHEGLRMLLREEGVTFQRLKTCKASTDPEHAVGRGGRRRPARALAARMATGRLRAGLLVTVTPMLIGAAILLPSLLLDAVCVLYAILLAALAIRLLHTARRAERSWHPTRPEHPYSSCSTKRTRRVHPTSPGAGGDDAGGKIGLVGPDKADEGGG
jgi:transposase